MMMHDFGIAAPKAKTDEPRTFKARVIRREVIRVPHDSNGASCDRIVLAISAIDAEPLSRGDVLVYGFSHDCRYTSSQRKDRLVLVRENEEVIVTYTAAADGKVNVTEVDPLDVNAWASQAPVYSE